MPCTLLFIFCILSPPPTPLRAYEFLNDANSKSDFSLIASPLFSFCVNSKENPTITKKKVLLFFSVASSSAFTCGLEFLMFCICVDLTPRLFFEKSLVVKENLLRVSGRGLIIWLTQLDSSS